jgi:hypothetical protein
MTGRLLHAILDRPNPNRSHSVTKTETTEEDSRGAFTLRCNRQAKLVLQLEQLQGAGHRSSGFRPYDWESARLLAEAQSEHIVY